MENGHQPINPILDLNNDLSGLWGLTKREYTAIAAMQGFCANADWAKNLNEDEWDSYVLRLTSGSVEIADKILEQLETTKQDPDGKFK